MPLPTGAPIAPYTCGPTRNGTWTRPTTAETRCCAWLPRPPPHRVGAADDTADDTAVAISDLSAIPHDTIGSILSVTWTQSESETTWLEFSVDEGTWLTSPPAARAAGSAEELALGIPFAAAVQLRVAWEGGSSETIEATTGPLPDGAPVASMVEGDPSGWDASSPYVLLCIYGDGGSIDGGWSFIIDRQGRTVWAKEVNTARVSLQTQLGASGESILIDQSSFWAIFDSGNASTIERVNIEGEVTQTWQTPGQHHPFTELPDGSIAWGAVSGYFSDEQGKLLSPDGTERTLWSCRDFLDAEANGGTPSDYCGSNTLSYSPETDTLLFSMFSLETMIEIDRQTGETVRYFGHTGENAWEFDPPESAFWWQHGGHFTATGTLLVSSKGEDASKETVLREYALDEESQTLIEVLTIGEGEGLYGDTMGEADYTIGGNIQHNLGSKIQLREYTPDGQVVWDVAWEGDMLGRSTPVPDLYVLR